MWCPVHKVHWVVNDNRFFFKCYRYTCTAEVMGLGKNLRHTEGSVLEENNQGVGLCECSRG